MADSFCQTKTNCKDGELPGGHKLAYIEGGASLGKLSRLAWSGPTLPFGKCRGILSESASDGTMKNNDATTRRLVQAEGTPGTLREDATCPTTSLPRS